ncbi:MAG: hypothetical protein RIS84_2069 [Pseudomonadota bacterium]|jgi:hypothetical protein
MFTVLTLPFLVPKQSLGTPASQALVDDSENLQTLQ